MTYWGRQLGCLGYDPYVVSRVSGSLAAHPRLRPVLSLWDLIYYGMITVSLIAPVTVFGLALSHWRRLCSLHLPGRSTPVSLRRMVGRLLYGFGRDNVLPCRLFGRLGSKHCHPTFNIWFVGLFAYGGALLIGYELAAELLDFGAFLGFMGVNLATVYQYYVVDKPWRRKQLFADLAVSGLGFLFCLGIWCGLARPAKIAGGVWLLMGIGYSAIKTRGFRRQPPVIELSEL